MYVLSPLSLQPMQPAPSPRKPKPVLQNSSLPSRTSSVPSVGGVASNPVTTPTTITSNSLGSRTTRSLSTSSSSGSSSQRGSNTKPAQLPSGPAYAIAAGGHQQNSLPTTLTSLTSGSSVSSSTMADSGSETSSTGTSGQHQQVALSQGSTYMYPTYVPYQ